MTKKLRTYSNEFKAEAVKKIADNNGNSLASPCKHYLICITKAVKANLLAQNNMTQSL